MRLYEESAFNDVPVCTVSQVISVMSASTDVLKRNAKKVTVMNESKDVM